LGTAAIPRRIDPSQPQKTVSPDNDSRLCLSGFGAGDRGRVRSPIRICYGWGERIPRTDTASDGADR